MRAVAHQVISVSYTHLDVYKRQSLPIQLFISPFVALSIKPLSSSNLYSLFSTTNQKDENSSQEEEEEYLFSRSASVTGLELLADMRSGGSVPVSYTHLDVYKRQV